MTYKVKFFIVKIKTFYQKLYLNRKIVPVSGAGSSGFILFSLYKFFKRIPYFCEMLCMDSPARST